MTFSIPVDKENFQVMYCYSKEYFYSQTFLKKISNKNQLKSIETKDDTFHEAVRPVLVLAQCFGIFPVSGLFSDDPENIKFNWNSCILRMTLYPFIGTFIMMSLSIRWFIQRVSLLRVLRINFFGTSWVTCILFINLASRWPEFSKKWRRCEMEMKIGYPPNLKFKCFLITGIYTVVAATEHALALLNGFEQSSHCGNAFQSLCFHWFPQLFTIVPFSLKVGVIVLSINTISTFIFNFIDIFIIINAYVLSQLFHQFNNKLALEHRHVRFYWHINRKNYHEIRELSSHVIERMSTLLFISVVQLISTICFSLYFNISPVERTFVGKIYYTMSLFYLLLRCLFLSVVLGWVYEESLRPKQILYSVPHSAYSSIVIRFQEEVCNNFQKLQFTGLGFFPVTRKTLIMIMSITITYQVIVQQFQSVMDDPEDGQAVFKNNSEDCSKYSTD